MPDRDHPREGRRDEKSDHVGEEEKEGQKAQVTAVARRRVKGAKGAGGKRAQGDAEEIEAEERPERARRAPRHERVEAVPEDLVRQRDEARRRGDQERDSEAHGMPCSALPVAGASARSTEARAAARVYSVHASTATTALSAAASATVRVWPSAPSTKNTAASDARAEPSVLTK